MKAQFYFKLQQNEAHLEIRAKRNNVCKCNMASSDGFHLILESLWIPESFFLFPNISVIALNNMNNTRRHKVCQRLRLAIYSIFILLSNKFQEKTNANNELIQLTSMSGVAKASGRLSHCPIYQKLFKTHNWQLGTRWHVSLWQWTWALWIILSQLHMLCSADKNTH